MNVLALSRYGRLGASSRTRFYQYVPFLRDFGIEVQISPLLRDDYLVRLYGNHRPKRSHLFWDYLLRIHKLWSVREFDLLWIEKELFPQLPSWFEQVLSAVGIRYLVDYDDAVFHNYDLSRNPLQRLMRKKIDKVMRNARVVICGNAYLADRARLAGARFVEIMPTVVDLARYSGLSRTARECIVVCWVGSPSTVKYLAFISSALKTLAAEYPVKLRVIGAQFSLPGLEVECLPWTEESEAGYIQNCDLGIMPLLDSPWERGKCGYKLIQYMACGLAVIASPVGVNQEIVVPGVNGYLATTPDDWLAAFRALCSDAGARRTMGDRGRLAVEQHYCLQATAPRLAQLLYEIAERGRADL